MDQLALTFEAPPTRIASAEAEPMTFREFASRHNFDIDLDHGYLRFPHGISKATQRRIDRETVRVSEAGSAALAAYNQAKADGLVRDYTAAESRNLTLTGHPDHDSVKAAWRVEIKRRRRKGAISALDAALQILTEVFDRSNRWFPELGLPDTATLEEQAQARIEWCEVKLG